MAQITLPPGSTSADLQAAVDNATSGDMIIISGNMPFTGTVTIPEGKEITIESDTGSHWVMSVPGSNIRHFTVRGSLILQSITLDGGNIGGGVTVTGGSLTMNEGAVQNCRSNTSGGGIAVSNGSLTMNEGAVVRNCYSGGQGGGAFVNPNGTITINGGVVKENACFGAGGGMYFQDSTFFMTAGEFSGNAANASGGAIQMLGNNTVTISSSIISGNTAGNQGGGMGISVNSNASLSDVIISGNTAQYNGGGAYIQGTVTMSGVTISGNTANESGGGIYNFAYAGHTTEITGESYITNNHAQNGGGIYTRAVSYNNLTTGSDTVFGCNWASTAYEPPMNAGTLYPDIQFASTSITDHPLNNFDINYSIGEPIDVYSNITYDANGGTGSYMGPNIKPGSTDTVLSSDETGISRKDYTFTGWNTEPDGSGTPYKPGDTITIACNVTLYAQWLVGERFTVTYNANGGIGAYASTGIPFATIYLVLTLAATGISRPDYTFEGWNTQPDGGGTSYSPGEIITITGDMTLYAQWRQNPVPKPKRICPKPVTKCRTAIEGQKIWRDNDNAKGTRPDNVEILLLRDGEVYDRRVVNADNGWAFGFCCLPVWKNSGHKYNYQIDEADVPGYTKSIEGYIVTNTINP